MRCNVFASRNMKELLRDPVSYIFCLAFPIFMLLMFSVINSSIPAEAHMDIFKVDHLASGIVFFAFTFVMLFASLEVSKDKTSSFLTRLFASPMTAFDFIVGYTLPLLAIALGQCVITFVTSAIIGIFTGITFNFANVLLSTVTLIPSAVMFIGFGILFGSILSDKSAPPISSILITVSAILGGIWMDIDKMGGALKSVCKVLPFYHGVRAARSAVLGNYSDITSSLIIISVYAVVVYLLAVFAFYKKMQSDNK